MEEYSNNEPDVRCLECGDRITYGRSDRKFCCPQCKNRFHNRIASDSRAKRARILGALDKNYEILAELLKSGRDSADIGEMCLNGFSPYTVTSVHKSGGKTVYFCFDIKYKISEQKVYKVEKLLTLPGKELEL